jgi:uncharacterized repeat protein (TIGR01451 family)
MFVGDIAVDSRQDQTVYLVADGLFKTVDGGTSWIKLNWTSGPPAGVFTRVTIDSLHPDTIYAAQSNGHIGRSIDGGQTWEDVSEQPTNTRIPNAILANPFKENTILVGTTYSGALEMTVGTDVEIVADIPDSVPYGSIPTTYKYTVRNLGPFHATALRAVIQLPASARDVTVSATAGACTVSGITITCTQPSMLAGRATLITVNSSNPTAGNVDVVARVQSSESDTNAVNNNIRSAVNVQAVSDLSVSASAPPAVTEGDSIIYSFAVANAGPNDATAVTVNVQLAAGLSLSVTATRGACTVNVSGLVVCAMGNLASGANATIAITVADGSIGSHLATAVVDATGSDPVTANNTTSVNTIVNARPNAGGSSSSSSSSSSSITITATGGSNGGGGSFSMLLLGLLVSFAVARAKAARQKQVHATRHDSR